MKQFLDGLGAFLAIIGMTIFLVAYVVISAAPVLIVSYVAWHFICKWW